MNPVEQLAYTQLDTSGFYVDPDGHTQVENIDFPVEKSESPTELLHKINKQSLWEDFFELANDKPDDWVRDLLEHFPKNEDYTIECLVTLLLKHYSDNYMMQMRLITQLLSLKWSEKLIHLQPKVILIARELIHTKIPKDKENEMVLEMFSKFFFEFEESL